MEKPPYKHWQRHKVSNLDKVGQSHSHCRYAMPLKINPPLLHHRKLLSARGWRGVLTPFSSGQAFSFGVKNKKTDFSVFLKFHDCIISRFNVEITSICPQITSILYAFSFLSNICPKIFISICSLPILWFCVRFSCCTIGQVLSVLLSVRRL